jgi:hypothetical protein
MSGLEEVTPESYGFRTDVTDRKVKNPKRVGSSRERRTGLFVMKTLKRRCLEFFQGETSRGEVRRNPARRKRSETLEGKIPRRAMRLVLV